MPELPHVFRPSQHSTGEYVEDAQAEIARLREELEHTHRLAMLGTLAAGIAHEINNILTPVLAYAQLACANASDRQLHTKALEKAMQGVQTATQITQAMLGFAGTPEEADSANLNAVLQSAIDCLGRDPAKDRIRVIVEARPDACVQMRPLALQQVLMNLILNACAVLRSRGGELTIEATDHKDGTTVIRITDSGPGIPAEIAGRLFEPFVTSRQRPGRTDRPANRQGGTGLGLAICKQLVEAACGTISASSAPGKGTTFTIMLPTARMQHAKAS